MDVANTLTSQYAHRSSGLSNDPIFTIHKQSVEQNPITFERCGTEKYNLSFSL